MATERVQVMGTCLVDAMAPDVGKATVRVLERAGCSVDYPEGQTCCGQPAYNVGMIGPAREMARHTLDVFDPTEGPIVVPSGSCAAMVVKHYPEILEGTPDEERAARVASRTRELSQYLVDDLGASSLDTAVSPASVTIHRSCHGLRSLGLTDQVKRLLEQVDGAELVPLEGAEECCGFGGMFAVEMPEVSAAIMRAKLERIAESGADIVVGGDISCLLHIEGGLRRSGSKVGVRHFAEMIAGSEDVS